MKTFFEIITDHFETHLGSEWTKSEPEQRVIQFSKERCLISLIVRKVCDGQRIQRVECMIKKTNGVSKDKITTSILNRKLKLLNMGRASAPLRVYFKGFITIPTYDGSAADAVRAFVESALGPL